ncbi:MAG TPA: glycosyltransferase family 2 protein [Acidimicrobiales bacterium]|nr:glycosyltransferase family 2 protein [Acidimicrobiales bacterium]
MARGPDISLPAPSQPRASIVVIGWRNAPLLERCLDALSRQQAPAGGFETIVILNGAVDDVVELVESRVTGARVLSARVNLGFGRACNRAASVARGEHLLFLNDDAVPDPDWVSALVQTAERHPAAGAVGSQVHGPDGRILEAGSLLWNNALISHLGRGAEGGSARHQFLRRVDYCSAAALLVRRSTWVTVGGFDERYFPGYYEDVDLCLSITALGQHILYQPRARVTHAESASIDHDFKHLVSDKSRAKFQFKWAEALSTYPPVPQTEDAFDRAAHAARHLHLRALLALDRDPDLRLTRAVVAAGYAVTAAGPLDPSIDPVELGDLGVEVVDGDLAGHLDGPAVLYDVAVLRGQEHVRTLAPVVRARQPWAAIVNGGEEAPPTDEGWGDVLRGARLRQAGLARAQA